MNLQREKTARASQHDMGWRASRRSLLPPVAGEVFLLTLPFIEPANRPYGYWDCKWKVSFPSWRPDTQSTWTSGRPALRNSICGIDAHTRCRRPSRRAVSAFSPLSGRHDFWHLCKAHPHIMRWLARRQSYACADCRFPAHVPLVPNDFLALDPKCVSVTLV